MRRIHWPIEQMKKWYQEGQTLQQIADTLCSKDWEAYWIKHEGEKYKPGQKVINGVLKRHMSLRRTGPPEGEKHPGWKGGKTVDKSGYILVHQPQHPHCNAAGYVREHRLVVEAFLGRFLTDTEVVHHIDDDPANNALDNLVLYETNAKHLAETLKGKIPAHTPAGIQKMRDAAHRRWAREQNKGVAIRRKLESDAQE